MFWKRKLSFAIVWVAASAVAATIVWRLPAVYKADAVIMVELQRIPEKYVASTVNSDLRDRLSALSQQILSYRRLLDIVQKYDLYREERKTHVQEDIIEMMRADIVTQVEDNWMSKGGRSEVRPGAFRVSFQGANPAVVALVTNQLANLFIDENLRSRETQAQGTSDFLQTQLDEAKRRLEDQEAKLSEYKLKYNGELPQQENSLIARVSQLHVRLQGINDGLERAEQTKKMVEASLVSARAAEAALLEAASQVSNPEARTAGVTPGGEPTKTSDRLEMQLAQARMHYTDDHPAVKALIALIPRIRKEEELRNPDLSKLLSKAGTNTADQAAATAAIAASPRANSLTDAMLREHERINSLTVQQQIATTQIESATAERKDILAQIADTEERVGRLPVREQQMIGLNRDYEISRANYQSLLDKRLSAEMATEMERAAKSERFAIVDAARVPERPVKPNRPLILGVSVAVAFFLGLVVAAGREIKNATLLGDWELPKGLPVLACVPEIVPANSAGEARQVPGARRFRIRPLVIVSTFALLVLLLIAATAVGVYFGKIRI